MGGGVGGDGGVHGGGGCLVERADVVVAGQRLVQRTHGGKGVRVGGIDPLVSGAHVGRHPRSLPEGTPGPQCGGGARNERPRWERLRGALRLHTGQLATQPRQELHNDNVLR